MKQRTKIAGIILIIAMMMTMFTLNVSAAATKGSISGITFKDGDNDISTGLAMNFGDASKEITIEVAGTNYTGETSATDKTFGPAVYDIEDPVSSNDRVVVAEYKDAKLKITAVGAGKANISVTATPKNEDEFGKAKTVKLNVEVTAAETVVTGSGYTIAATTKLAGNTAAGDTAALTIDMVAETAYAAVEIGAYTLDGKKWNTISIGTTAEDAASISKLLDKGGSKVMFAESADKKGPEAGSAIWVIGKVGARPKNPKLVVEYGTLDNKDKNKVGEGKWSVTGIPNGASLSYVPSEDGKAPMDGRIWGDFPSTGVYVTPFGCGPFGNSDEETDKPVKETYLAKLNPVVEVDTEDSNKVTKITPASKVMKLKVSGESKPAIVKVDYKKELVVGKAGMAYSCALDEKVFTKTTAKTGIAFKALFEADETAIGDAAGILVWTAATVKKPASGMSEIAVYNYSTFVDDGIADGFDEAKGTYKLPKGYEVWDTAKKKWVTSAKVSKTTTFDIRVKGTAKFDAKNTDPEGSNPWLKDGTVTASEAGKLTLTWDNKAITLVEEDKENKVQGKYKAGIKSVTVIAPVKGPTITTTSTIEADAVGATVEINGTGFNTSATASDFEINVGTTELTVSGVSATANTVTITFTGTAKPGMLTIQAKVSAFNPDAAAPSNTVRIRIYEAPSGTLSITTQPTAATTVTVGSISGTLSIAAEDEEASTTLSYKWYQNTSASTSGATQVSGATTADLTIPADLTIGDHYFYCVVSTTGQSDDVTSNFAKVTVEAVPPEALTIDLTKNEIKSAGTTPIGAIPDTIDIGTVELTATTHYTFTSNAISFTAAGLDKLLADSGGLAVNASGYEVSFTAGVVNYGTSANVIKVSAAPSGVMINTATGTSGLNGAVAGVNLSAGGSSGDKYLVTNNNKIRIGTCDATNSNQIKTDVLDFAKSVINIYKVTDGTTICKAVSGTPAS